jgi:hypothetical protein
MQNQNLPKEQKAIRNILYGIIALTISVSFIVDFYALIDPKNKYFYNCNLWDCILYRV